MASLAPTTHAQQMDAMYRVQRHFYDLTRKYYLLGRDRLIQNLDAGPGCTVLEVGCGTGRNLIAAAQRWPEAQFTGLDISASMLKTACFSISRKHLSPRIALVQADACDFAASAALVGQRYDRIFMSYTLSMIPGWELALEEALDALAPGGSLHIVDFGQQEMLPRWFRSLLLSWLRHFHVTPRAALPAVLEDLSRRHNRKLQCRPLYRGYAWEAVLSAG
ncbi:MAG: class I SAM-dependent methyltransferase [Sphingobium sp.]